MRYLVIGCHDLLITCWGFTFQLQINRIKARL